MRNQGYTLIELMVVIAIFAIVMTVISVSFNRILAGSGQVIKSTETEIGGLIGLELMRVDLGFAGFGLPWSLGGATYGGESPSHLVDNNPDTDAAKFNDGSADGPPRALLTANNKGFNGSDYLVLKGTALGMNDTARAWSYMNYSSTGPVVKQAKSEVELAPGNGDQVIVVNTALKGGVATRDLIINGTAGAAFWVTFNTDNMAQLKAFWPRSAQDRYLVYGIAPSTKPVVSYPFNRADYYIGSSDNPSSICAPGTGVLYRGEVSQGGDFSPVPVLDCVADLQVIFLLDTNGDGQPDLHTDDISNLSAADIRAQVKEVHVYILAQQGKKDAGFSYPNSEIVVGDPHFRNLGSVWNTTNTNQYNLVTTFGSDWMHYHWKVYTIVAQPKNLQ